ncbi:MAG: CotH kinase family protein [Bacteroidota bacterium]
MKKISLPFIFFLLCLSLLVDLEAQVLFNELCSDNENLILDEDGDRSDWIELYNAGSKRVSLKGYSLTDDPDELYKWIFPEISIEPKEIMLIFASDKNRINGELHTNFKLSKGGEEVILVKPDGNASDQLSLPALEEDRSYGRSIDGSDQWVFFLETTPGESNNGSLSQGFAAQPRFDQQQAFHAQSILLTMDCNEPGCEIFYTIDGNRPDRSSIPYTGPVRLDTTTAVRAVTYSAGLEPSTIKTRTYFINDDHRLSVMALTTDPANLWDWETGIFQLGPTADTVFPFYGANFWEETEIPIYMELSDTDQQLEEEYPLGARTHGGRGARVRPNKPLRLMAKKVFGTGLMVHKFFDNREVNQFERLVLRNASGDADGAYMRDAFLHRYFINEGLDIDAMAFRPLVLYINGVYWGVMHLRERPDKHYLQYHYQADAENVDILEEEDLVVEGDFHAFDSMQAFVNAVDLQDEENFAQAARYFDVESLADYFIVQTITNNFDWPTNNIKYWRERNEESRWRFLLFDMDVSLGRHVWTVPEANSFASKISKDTLRIVNVLRALLTNEDYKNYFINRHADLINTTFEANYFKEEILRSRDELDPEMPRHFDRWGGSYDAWQGDRMEELLDYAERRPEFARTYVKDYFELEEQVQLKLQTFPEEAGIIHLNTITPRSLPWEGWYYKGVPVQLSAEPLRGYVFSHWEFKENPSPDSLAAITYDFQSSDEVTAVFKRTGADPQFFLHPNPVDRELTIDFELEQATRVQLSFYDYSGRLLYETPEEFLEVGSHTKTLNTSRLLQGMYLARVRMGEFTETVKFVKMR